MRWQALDTMAQEKQRAGDRGKVARRLVGELHPYTRTIVAALLLIVVAAAAQGVGPWLVGRAIDHDIAGEDVAGLARTIAILFGVWTVSAFAQRGQTRRIGAIGQRVLAEIRMRLFAKLQQLPMAWFDKHPVGDTMSRLASDVDTLNQLLSQGMTQLLGSLMALVGIVIAMLALNWRMALVSFTIIPAMLATTAFFARRARAAYRKTRKTVGDVTADLQEQVVGVRQAQAFNRTERNIENFRERNAANRDANVSATGITSAFSPAIDVLSTLATALVVGYGGWLVWNERLSIGLLAAFLLYVQQFFRPVQLAASVYAMAQSALAGGERIYGILDEESEPVDAADAKVLADCDGAIEFRGVCFAYEERGGKRAVEGGDGAGTPPAQVLSDVNFKIAAGQTIALVGKTGAGKTTIASLVPRFYDVTAGTVLVDGHDVKNVTRASLRRRMAMVLQEPFLFSGTLAENIAYGRPDASREDLEIAARAVDAHGFIAAMQKGYDTVIGEGGGTLSQGQRQLVAFARAVLADPKVLILDEATANIDTRTEQTIQRALKTLLAGRTSIVIAHRLSTIRDADQILVVDAGRIVEQGTHDELIAKDGTYAELHRRQFRDPARPSA